VPTQGTIADLNLDDVCYSDEQERKYLASPGYGEVSSAQAQAQSGQGKSCQRVPDISTLTKGVSNNFGRKCSGEKEICSGTKTKTFVIDGEIRVSETCSGGCCQKHVQATDGSGKTDAE
jgi:hypothetical protein